MKRFSMLIAVVFFISCNSAPKTAATADISAFPLKSALINGYKMVYTDQGRGEVIVLIHGLSSDMESFATIIPGLKKTHRVIAVDLLGNGKSDKPDISYSMKSKARSVKLLLDNLGIKKAIIAGHSNGGAVGMRFAIDYPSRIMKLILIAPGGLIKLSPQMAAMFKMFVTNWVNNNFKSKENTKKLIKSLVYKWTPEWENNLNKRLKRMDTPAFQKVRELMKRATLRTVLSAVQTRTMEELLRFINNYFVNKKIVRLECGHMVQMELPRQAYTEIYDFIK
jgi:pimeloyl-ACP methyl ester carboxylesterase